ncbi:uncharacterized protein BT62DRAFT_1078854 [Guyanagaster necrorhizus]|uniref:Uncharacterized protein n=1 Tax=Guyanagaster necrorhizus TaxID=856835 RepID=A0A9P7VL45_9AGAR|nr:uncharacterized protein BT62DRAFT_1078854 [Guyanagaster necrorhizus MCA 3950]KAG7443128.1 hypothetical protein BT62DRAFT_1078854 [Guyanagaster necrorhizus MCA 3950]
MSRVGVKHSNCNQISGCQVSVLRECSRWSYNEVERAEHYFDLAPQSYRPDYVPGDGTVVPQSGQILGQIYHDFLPNFRSSPWNAALLQTCASSGSRISPPIPPILDEEMLNRSYLEEISTFSTKGNTVFESRWGLCYRNALSERTGLHLDIALDGNHWQVISETRQTFGYTAAQLICARDQRKLPLSAQYQTHFLDLNLDSIDEIHLCKATTTVSILALSHINRIEFITAVFQCKFTRIQSTEPAPKLYICPEK